MSVGLNEKKILIRLYVSCLKLLSLKALHACVFWTKVTNSQIIMKGKSETVSRVHLILTILRSQRTFISPAR